MTIRQLLARARARYIKDPTPRRLRWYLLLKARSGAWDMRYCRETGVAMNVTPWVKMYITRGFAAGLVPTSTTGGTHAPRSYHTPVETVWGRCGRAADLGLRAGEVGTARGRRKMERFQRAEYARRSQHGITELIGPVNNRIILDGRPQVLAEGSPLENQHDGHVHGGHR